MVMVMKMNLGNIGKNYTNEYYKRVLSDLEELINSNEPITDEMIDEIIDVNKYRAKTFNQNNVNWEEIKNRVTTTIDLYEDDDEPDVFIDESNYKPWINLTQINNGTFWKRYKYYLEKIKHWSTQSIKYIDKTTNRILDNIGNPKNKNSWKYRGLVVGYVQSGKTSNYIGLINKALDQGYKFIVVLAGVHDNLRCQTQDRIDKEVLGYMSKDAVEYNDVGRASVYGVGKIKQINGQPLPKLGILSVTSSDSKGDFKKNRANSIIGHTNDPIMLVIKKNARILGHLYNWISKYMADVDKKSGKKYVMDKSLLLIDDEADHASINTSRRSRKKIIRTDDVTAINKKIRMLLDIFKRSSYVGYTATPYANIFIDPNDQARNLGKDLFPSNFIISLKPPKNYISPKIVFGIDDNDAELDSEDPLPIINIIDDYNDFVPNKHKSNHIIKNEVIPESLQNAILFFILACSIRYARGDINEHNSMLIHVSRYVNVQQQIYDLVEQFVSDIYDRIVREIKKEGKLMVKLKDMYYNDFLPKHKKIRDKLPYIPGLKSVEWEDVKKHFYLVIEKIYIKQINGNDKDIIDYKRINDGINIIMIGGDKLSRGLTLEGLTVSYYLRSAKMYDTLMQMGRWFGYRDGYIDVCRLYTSEELFSWYRSITLANEELRLEFERMSIERKTPMEFGLKIRAHPDILITAANKMKNGETILLSLDGITRETYIFYKDKSINERNKSAVEQFIKNIGGVTRYYPEKTEKNKSYIWENVNYRDIINLIDNYKFHEKARNTQPSLIKKYIEKKVKENSLVNWTVALISLRDEKEDKSVNIAGYNVIPSFRSNIGAEYDNDIIVISKNRIASPTDELIDMCEKDSEEIEDEFKKLNEYYEKFGSTKRKRKVSKVKIAKKIRGRYQRGLLLIYPLVIRDKNDSDKTNTEINNNSQTTHTIGLVFSFPEDGKETKVEYRVNNVYWEQEFGSNE